jgi:uncharacterized membrane protein YGL010W
MRDAAALLVQYAQYHRDPRNIATHLVGIPVIVLAIGVLLARPSIPLNPGSTLALSPAWALWAAATLWYAGRSVYSRPVWPVALAVILSNAVLMAAAHWIAVEAASQWLIWGAVLFVGGWALQFLGHYYEGRKPAFLDDLAGLLVGPMFVCAEALFALGRCTELRERITREAGAVQLRDLHAGALR